jgi:integrase
MPSSWLTRRAPKDGSTRYRVEYRLGGRESATRYGGSFKTKREADERRRWVDGELAGRRVPELRFAATAGTVTLRTLADRWQASRVDVAAGTMQTYRVALGRLLPRLGDMPVEKLDAQTVAGLVAELHAVKLKKQTRKTVSVLAMVLDHAGVQPNPARDKLTVKLPREERRQVQPPTAEHVEAVVRLLPARYRLPALVLDATGMRIGELEALTWGDMDEPRGRWRIATSKTGRPRWVTPADVLYAAVLELCPRDDRHPDRRVFEHVTGDRLRTALTRACTAAGVPAFSPHDLRHRRVSLLHLGRRPLGQDRRAGRARRPCHDGTHVHARRRGRTGTRLRKSVAMNYADADEGCERCANLTKKGLWTCAFCGRVIDNRSAFQLWMAQAAPYLKITAVVALPGLIAVFIGRAMWGLTWSDTWEFALSAVLIMLFAGSGGAAVQAHFLGRDSAIGKPDRTGDDLFAKRPFVFGAPWVLASVLAAALFVK